MHVVITKVIRESLSVPMEKNGTMTIGQMIDDHIAESARRGDTIQAVTLEIGDDEWSKIQEDHPRTPETRPTMLEEAGFGSSTAVMDTWVSTAPTHKKKMKPGY